MNDSNRKLAAKNQQMASDLLDIQRSVIKPLVDSNGGKWIKDPEIYSIFF